MIVKVHARCQGVEIAEVEDVGDTDKSKESKVVTVWQSRRHTSQAITRSKTDLKLGFYKALAMYLVRKYLSNVNKKYIIVFAKGRPKGVYV